MISLAIRILFGDQVKVYGLVFGVAFATVLITQQSGLFIGLMKRVQNVIAEAGEVEIWVMDPATEHLNLSRTMRDAELMRVRGISGIAWASPLFKSNLPVRSRTGKTSTALLMGVDDVTFAGMTKWIILGTQEDLRQPDAIAIDRVGYMRLWPNEAITTGKILELNDRRARVVAITDAAPAFAAQVIIYTRYGEATKYVPHGRNSMSFILVKTEQGSDPQEIASAITKQTGLKAEVSEAFSRSTVQYHVKNTGIAINFATTIILGIFVGIAIVGLTFSLFVSDNLRHYAVLKAIGVNNIRLTGMVLCQVAFVAIIGFAIGTGLAAAFFDLVSSPTSALRGFTLPWWMPLMTLAVMSLSILLSTLIGLRRVLMVDPAIVFKA